LKKVQFILILSNRYGQALTYQVNGAGPQIPLDTLQSFIGNGSVSLLGTGIETLEFTNGFPAVEEISVAIKILVGRNAVEVT
jgi:hypothetical protein